MNLLFNINYYYYIIKQNIIKYLEQNILLKNTIIIKINNKKDITSIQNRSNRAFINQNTKLQIQKARERFLYRESLARSCDISHVTFGVHVVLRLLSLIIRKEFKKNFGFYKVYYKIFNKNSILLIKSIKKIS